MTNDGLLKPGKIYKYVSLDVAKIILRDGTLKFSKPSTFNDPFDCDVNLLDFNFADTINPRVVEEIKALKNIFKDKLDSKSKEFWEKPYKGAQLEKINSSRILLLLINK